MLCSILYTSVMAPRNPQYANVGSLSNLSISIHGSSLSPSKSLVALF